MLKLVNDWYRRHFTDPQVAILALLLVLGASILYAIGDVLTPLLAAIIIAYLLDGAVSMLKKYKVPRLVAILSTFSVFIILLLIVLFILAPLLFRQATQFVLEIPKMFAQGQTLLMQLPEKYPNIISEQQVSELLIGIRTQITDFSQLVVSFSLSSVSDLLTFMVYLVVVPLLIFFFLKDKEIIINWFKAFLPTDRSLVSQVWHEMNGKIAGYVRGKFAEIVVVWVITYVTFMVFNLNYAMLLSFAVGISVLIPYVGAALVTIPVAIVAYFQWGYTTETLYVIIAYGIIQFLDGNLLVPLLFSEMVNLHPAAIITAVLLFGGLWGVWGVFFAIPLATLIHAIINSWPRAQKELEE
ncbi:AI-2E family transporter [uncultured Cocleimonas sp.]|uniref:AI-2E family transporter n=1 Tax=uncultured Cocleimonas sp. TaxID=1051587 RepID=UPI00260E1BB6|nr:AI-2E family transporter [uncultured Cocleimonas sp.]